MYRVADTIDTQEIAVKQLPISVIIPTYNEAVNLADCLESLAGWVGEIFVVDSGSDDATQAIAASYGATVVCHAYEGPRQQWEWALNNLPLQHEWLLMMDADLRISPLLRDAIHDVFQGNPACNGYYLGRLQVFRGQPLRYGGMYPRYQLRLVCLAKASFSSDNTFIDEQMSVSGPTALLKGDLIEANLKEDDILFYLKKHLRYMNLQARQELVWRQEQPPAQPLSLTVLKNPTKRKQWLKDRWNRFPFYVRPFIYFMYRYIFRLGFLDGKQGFVYHFLQAWWYRVIVDVRLEELIKEASIMEQK